MSSNCCCPESEALNSVMNAFADGKPLTYPATCLSVPHPFYIAIESVHFFK